MNKILKVSKIGEHSLVALGVFGKRSPHMNKYVYYASTEEEINYLRENKWDSKGPSVLTKVKRTFVEDAMVTLTYVSPSKLLESAPHDPCSGWARTLKIRPVETVSKLKIKEVS